MQTVCFDTPKVKVTVEGQMFEVVLVSLFPYTQGQGHSLRSNVQVDLVRRIISSFMNGFQNNLHTCSPKQVLVSCEKLFPYA